MHAARKAALGLATLAALGLAAAPPARAQASPVVTISVDEQGNGTIISSITGPSGFALPSDLVPDPGPGGLDSTLTYNLLGPPSLVAGDVLLTEPGDAIQDVVRFNPAGTGGDPNYPASLVFYSDNLGGADALADTPGPPQAFYTNFTVIPEVGPEGDNGAFYTPTANQPGFVPGFAVSYHFISDSPVPEPSQTASLCLGALGVLGLMVRARRRRTTAA